MARLPRLVVPDQPHYILQRGHDGLTIFRDPQDYSTFLSFLREAARQFQVAIHAYAVLPDHWQVLATPSAAQGLARMMQWVGRQYVPYFNRRYARSGTLWQGRYRCTVLEARRHLLPGSVCIEWQPVYAQLASAPADYPWSSYGHHVGTHRDPMVTDHAVYWDLGNTPFAREAAYRAVCEQGLSSLQRGDLQKAVQGGWPLGSPEFKKDLGRVAGRRVVPGNAGRPRKS